MSGTRSRALVALVGLAATIVGGGAARADQPASPPAAEPFRLDPAAVSGEASALASLELSPRLVLATFGAPYFAGERGTSGELRFVAARGGTVFRLYDWQATALDAASCGPAPRKLWLQDRPAELQVGGVDDPARFVEWIKRRLAAQARRQSAATFAAAVRLLAEWRAGKLPLAALEKRARAVRNAWRADKYGPATLKGPRLPPTVTVDKKLLREWGAVKDRPCADKRAAPEGYAYPAHDPRSILGEVLALLGDVRTGSLALEDAAAIAAFLGAPPGTEDQAWRAWHAHWKSRRAKVPASAAPAD